MGLTSSPIDWYAARAAGIVAYLLLTAVVLVGLTLAGQVRLSQWPKFAVAELHRYGGLLVGVFVSIHVATIALDTYTPFSLTQLVVPLTSGYRPVWTALGIVAAELLLALAVANALRRRVPYRLWRRLHYGSFLVWAAATVHGVGAGTDARSVWLLLLYAASVAGVLAALAWRVARNRISAPARKGLAGAAGLAGLAAVVALAAAPHGGSARAAVAPPRSFSDAFSGSIAQRDGAGGALLSVVGRGTGARRVAVRIDLVTPDGQTITDTALQLEDLASKAVCRGTVTSIGSAGFQGSCSFGGGATRSVNGSWQLGADRHVSGRLSVRA